MYICMCYLRFIWSDCNVKAAPPKLWWRHGVGAVMGHGFCVKPAEMHCTYLETPGKTSYVGTDYLTNGSEAQGIGISFWFWCSFWTQIRMWINILKRHINIQNRWKWNHKNTCSFLLVAPGLDSGNWAMKEEEDHTSLTFFQHSGTGQQSLQL